MTSTPAKPARRVFLETFGCQMNVLDSQLVKGQLTALGYAFVDQPDDADVVLYNTCSVREHAEQKVYSRLGLAREMKRQRPDVVVGVLGCMAEREGADMAKRFEAVDLMCGPGELDKVPMLIDNAVKTGLGNRRMSPDNAALQGNTHRRSGTLTAAADQLELLDLSRSFSPDEHQGSAYVRITRGCNKFCTYCVVPNTRGAEVHRAPEAIIEECRRLVGAGVIEITLLGQTVNHYHYDHTAAETVDGIEQPQIGAPVTNARGLPTSNARGLPTPGSSVTTFAQLLKRIHDKVPDLQRLRFVTSFPRDFGDDILDVIADHPRICKYLHLPVQSGSNRILKAMNRGYTVEQYRDLLARVKAKLPGATIASDLICGFPGETDEDHQLTCDLLRESMFKNCFIFKYSPRPGTAAYDRLEDDVPETVKKQRNNELLAIQSENSRKVHEQQVGKTVRVFVESISQKARKAQTNAAGQSIHLGWQRETTQLTGRTDGDLIVMFDGDESQVGSIVDVEITRAAPLALFGAPARVASVTPS